MCIGRARMEQGVTRVHSQLVFLRLHNYSSTRRLVGISIRRQARLWHRCPHHAHCYVTGSDCGSYSCIFADRVAGYHGTWMCKYDVCHAISACVRACVRACVCVV
jgi:hypothetical protein